MKTASIMGRERLAIRPKLIKAIFAWSFIIMMISASPVFAASLWSEESDAIYTKQARKFKVGDLLTLIIVEQASASYNSGTEGEEASDVRVGPGEGLLNNLLPYLRGQTSTSYSGEGSTNRGGELTARLTVAVIGIEPGTNNLLIEGKQRIEVNRDVQELYVRGKVRPEDISVDNTVLSSFVADAEIKLAGEGSYSDYSKPGILTRFFSWLL
ncbi:MAG TPA: flagellar basal body L-ring protein FlgH [Bacillota bacterium]